MGTINISREEKDALKAIAGITLSQLIEQCLRDKRVDALRSLRLENCGPYVYAKFRAFGEDLAEYADAKAEKKRAETERRANRAASDLTIDPVGYRTALKHQTNAHLRVGSSYPTPINIPNRTSFLSYLR